MRSQYDSDITTWSPQGRIFQIEYAMEAVKQGSASIGLKSKTHAVVCSLQRSQSKLSSYQQKVFEIDENVGISIAGLTADARILCKWLRSECLNYRYVYDEPFPVNRLTKKLADKCQRSTTSSGRRPYGIGLLIVGVDVNGPHLYETDPAGNYYEYKAQAIGDRCQSGRTYLERNYTSFPDASPEELIQHGLKALRSTLAEKKETLSTKASKEPDALDEKNCVVGIVGIGQPFRIITGEDIRPYIESIDEDKGLKMDI